jgi:LPS-assembly lipoprotein
MKLLAILGALAGALALTSCGFSPIYATAGADFAPLRDINVETRGTQRIDFIFEQVMSDKLGAYTPSSAYRLETILSETRQGFGIRVDDVATRYESTVTANYRLIRTSDGVILTRGRRMGVASYDVSDDPYSELSSEQRSLERAVELVAEKVRLDLTLYFADAGQDAGQEEDS